LKLASSYSELRTKLEREVTRLILRIENGKRLRGSCDCAKINERISHRL
jgi:hypothetical protein